MRMSDWSSDVCSSDLRDAPQSLAQFIDRHAVDDAEVWMVDPNRGHRPAFNRHMASHGFVLQRELRLPGPPLDGKVSDAAPATRSEEHTSELQSLMRTSYAVFCLEKKRRDNVCGRAWRRA